MSNLYLKIMKGSDNSDGFDLIPLPVGAAVSFSNEPPQVTAGDVIYPITHSVYLINDTGVTITQFTVKPVEKWEVKTVTVEETVDLTTEVPKTEMIRSFLPEEKRIFKYSYKLDRIESPFVGDVQPRNSKIRQIIVKAAESISSRDLPAIIKYMGKDYVIFDHLAIRLVAEISSGDETVGAFEKTFKPASASADLLSGKGPDVVDAKNNNLFAHIKGNDSYDLQLEDWTPVRDGVSMDRMFVKQPESFEHLGWLVEDISKEMDPKSTAVYLTGGEHGLGYTCGVISSFFIDNNLIDVPTEVMDEIFIKYGLDTPVKISHKEVKATYVRIPVTKVTTDTRTIKFGMFLDPNNEADALEINEQNDAQIRHRMLPYHWLVEDISVEWYNDAVTVDHTTGYVRGMFYAKLIDEKELGIPKETLEAIDCTFPDNTPLLINGGGRRSSYLRFISSSATNERWVQYARLIADNRIKNKLKVESSEETHPLHPEN